VVWVGAPGEILGIQVDFKAVDNNGQQQEFGVFLPAGETQQVVMLPLAPDGNLSYHYEINQITTAGVRPIRSGEGHSTVLVVQVSGD
jgi:hypothetical protein